MVSYSKQPKQPPYSKGFAVLCVLAVYAIAAVVILVSMFVQWYNAPDQVQQRAIEQARHNAYWDALTPALTGVSLLLVGLATLIAAAGTLYGLLLVVQRTQDRRYERTPNRRGHLPIDTRDPRYMEAATMVTMHATHVQGQVRAVRELARTPLWRMLQPPAPPRQPVGRSEPPALPAPLHDHGTDPTMPPVAAPPVPRLLDALADAIHILIVAETGAGKSNLLQMLALRLPGVIPIDPHGGPVKWGGIVPVGAGQNYAEARQVLRQAVRLMDYRIRQIATGERAELDARWADVWLLFDEFRDLNQVCPDLAPLIQDVLTKARKVKIHLAGASQDESVASLGLVGAKDVARCFTHRAYIWREHTGQFCGELAVGRRRFAVEREPRCGGVQRSSPPPLHLLHVPVGTLISSSTPSSTPQPVVFPSPERVDDGVDGDDDDPQEREAKALLRQGLTVTEVCERVYKVAGGVKWRQVKRWKLELEQESAERTEQEPE